MIIEITRIENFGESLQVYALVDGVELSTITKSPVMWGDYSDEALIRGIYNLFMTKALAPPYVEPEQIGQPGGFEPPKDVKPREPDAARLASVAALEKEYNDRTKAAKDLGKKAFIIEIATTEESLK